MKKIFNYSIVFIALMLGVQVSIAQTESSTIKVSFKGDHPTILDFMNSYSLANPDDEMIKDFVKDIKKGSRVYKEGEYRKIKLVKDVNSGYVSWELLDGFECGSLIKIEMCYWNCDNKQEKIFAINWIVTRCAGMKSIMTFFRYNNATRMMHEIPAPYDRQVTPIDFMNLKNASPEKIKEARHVSDKVAKGIDEEDDDDDDLMKDWALIFDLPRKGKNIEIHISNEDEFEPSEIQRCRYVWNGNGFNLTVMK